MRLEQLHYLIELYRTRSFSKAAENVYITQPSLSTAISSLEEELGVQLFERTRTGVYPTPLGEEIIRIAREMVDREQHIYELARGKSNQVESIQILSIPAACHGILLEAVKLFQKDRQPCNIFLREMAPTTLTGDAVRLLAKEPGTFVICTVPPPTAKNIIQRLQKDRIKATFLHHDKFMCIASPSHPIAKEAVTYENFIKYPEVDLNLMETIPENDFYFDMQNVGLSETYQGLKTNTHIEVDSLSSLKQLVMTDVGISVMPSLILYNDRDCEKGDILALPFSDVNIGLDFYLLESTQYPLKPIEKNFLDKIIHLFHNLEDYDDDEDYDN